MVQMHDNGPSPFHPGEQKIQTLVGARDLSEALGGNWHKKKISPSSASFFASQSLLYFTSRWVDIHLAEQRTAVLSRSRVQKHCLICLLKATYAVPEILKPCGSRSSTVVPILPVRANAGIQKGTFGRPLLWGSLDLF